MGNQRSEVPEDIHPDVAAVYAEECHGLLSSGAWCPGNDEAETTLDGLQEANAAGDDRSICLRIAELIGMVERDLRAGTLSIDEPGRHLLLEPTSQRAREMAAYVIEAA